MDMNDVRVLRARHAAADDDIDRIPASKPPSCAEAQLVQTTTVNTYPSTAASFFACNPVQISGVAAEGNPATYVPDTETVIYCWNSGSQVPPSGTNAVAHLVGGRFVITFNG